MPWRSGEARGESERRKERSARRGERGGQPQRASGERGRERGGEESGGERQRQQHRGPARHLKVGNVQEGTCTFLRCTVPTVRSGAAPHFLHTPPYYNAISVYARVAPTVQACHISLAAGVGETPRRARSLSEFRSLLHSRTRGAAGYEYSRHACYVAPAAGGSGGALRGPTRHARAQR